MGTNLSVKTALAAQITGIGYEGFRTWLKRGLLKTTGTLPEFYAKDAQADLADAKRWRWSTFGFADLCSFRLTKTLLDAGLSWEVVNPIVSNEDLWRSHREDGDASHYLAIFPQHAQWTLYNPGSLAAELGAGIIKQEWMVLVNLQDLRRSVIFRTRAVALRTMADHVKRTAQSAARASGDSMSPDEQAAHQAAIEELADSIHALAAEAEHGAGSYQEFEQIMQSLHQRGMMVDSEALSTFASTCA